MVARLTHTPIEVHNSSTNSTLDDNPITFPLGQSLYVDATHEVVVLNSQFIRILLHCFCLITDPPPCLVITALNLTTFAESGPLPYTHVPEQRTFRVAELAPFATNIQFQRMFQFAQSDLHTEPNIYSSSPGMHIPSWPTNPRNHQRWCCASDWH